MHIINTSIVLHTQNTDTDTDTRTGARARTHTHTCMCACVRKYILHIIYYVHRTLKKVSMAMACPSGIFISLCSISTVKSLSWSLHIKWSSNTCVYRSRSGRFALKMSSRASAVSVISFCASLRTGCSPSTRSGFMSGEMVPSLFKTNLAYMYCAYVCMCVREREKERVCAQRARARGLSVYVHVNAVLVM